MPGSLFSRSVSPDPHGPGADARHVHFRPSPPGPSAPTQKQRPFRRSSAHSISDADRSGSQNAPLARSTARASQTELRPRTIPSVKAVVRRFCADEDTADPSLLLPISPSRTRTATRRPDVSTDGGRRRSSLGEPRDEDDESLSSDSGRHPRTLDKGKQRERQLSPAPSRSLERRSVSEMTVRGKEQELLAAREERDRNERRWGRDTPAVEVDAERKRDKERIRALEREIAHLKEEVMPPSSPSLLNQYSSSPDSSPSDPLVQVEGPPRCPILRLPRRHLHPRLLMCSHRMFLRGRQTLTRKLSLDLLGLASDTQFCLLRHPSTPSALARQDVKVNPPLTSHPTRWLLS